ncbi:MAG TPA: methyltransferase domain-containing protein [Roseiflexaceae bacterium]|nr:methyltransferase domain-containing protein [Roseiflexaceae bacterium]
MTPPTPPAGESYTPGHTANATSFMARRRAASHAAFLLPHLSPGMRVLDCGCGPGTISLDLAAVVAPGSFLGIDIGAGQIEQARHVAAERGLVGARFEVASVYAIPASDAAFDAALAHALLEHLAHPLDALREIRRVLRPGAVVAVCSPDWGGFIVAPDSPELQAAIGFYRRIQERSGGDTLAGRKLGGLLLEAGFAEVSVTAQYECYEDRALIAEYLAQRIERAPELDRALVQELADPGAVTRHAAALRAWSEQPGGLFAQAWVAAVGFAPGA